MISKTSMLYWYPKIRGLQIALPKTQIVKVPYDKLVSIIDGKMLPDNYLHQIAKIASKIGYPLFLRTDMGSAKHYWNHTCFVSEPKLLFTHISSLIDTTLAQGMFGELDPNALVFREYLHLESTFRAFDGMPVAKERRYFINDGKVICHHPYWIKDAIEADYHTNKPDNWRELLAELNIETDTEIKLLTSIANKVSKVCAGYWSVDFAKGLNDFWYLIDMAEGEKSWHPDCKHIPQ